jgi:hypothetical protein
MLLKGYGVKLFVENRINKKGEALKEINNPHSFRV